MPRAPPAAKELAVPPEAGNRATAAATSVGTFRRMCRSDISDAAKRSATVAMSLFLFTSVRNVLVLTTTSLRNAVTAPRRLENLLLCATEESSSLGVALSEEETVSGVTTPDGAAVCCGNAGRA